MAFWRTTLNRNTQHFLFFLLRVRTDFPITAFYNRRMSLNSPCWGPCPPSPAAFDQLFGAYSFFMFIGTCGTEFSLYEEESRGAGSALGGYGATHRKTDGLISCILESVLAFRDRMSRLPTIPLPPTLSPTSICLVVSTTFPCFFSTPF